MGIFDIFKKKKTPPAPPRQEVPPQQEPPRRDPPPQQEPPRREPPQESTRREPPSGTPQPVEPVDKNRLFFETLRGQLEHMGLPTQWHPQYLALQLEGGLDIAAAVIENPNNHPSLMQVMTMTIHPQWFPEGITDNVVGLGITLEEQVNTAVQNYLHNTFAPIQDSLTDSHSPELDFTVPTAGREVLWHPKLSGVGYQGPWPSRLEGEPLYDLLLPSLQQHLHGNKLHWLKVYVSRQASGEIIAECNLDNQPWQVGYDLLMQYAQGWRLPSAFYGMKEFMVFRRCDGFD